MMLRARRDSLSVFLASAVLLFFLLLPAISGPPSLAEEPRGWYPQDSGTSVHLMAVEAVDETNAWITGYNGTILKTTDGGATWVAQNSGVTSELRSLSVVDASTAWAAGDYLLRTTNGGATWSKLNLGKNFYAYHVCAVSTSVVWVAGNYWVESKGDYQRQVRKSINGGVSWTTYVLPTTEPINDLCAVDASTAWVACMDGVILKTTNGGSVWNKLSTETGDTFTDMDVLNADTVFAVSGNRVYRTWDGGMYWNFSEIGLGYLRAVEAVSPSTIWAAGDNGLIVKSTDGGGTWTRQQPQDTNLRNYYGISAVNADVAWIAGSDGKILHTVNGGVEPPPVPEITHVQPYTVYPLSLVSVYGNNFGPFTSPEDYGKNFYLSLDSETVPFSNILKWEDDEVDFRVPSGLPPGPVEVSVTVNGFSSNRESIIVLEAPTKGWRLQDPGVNMPLFSVSAADADTAWAVGYNGTIIKTADGGNTWTPQNSGTTKALLAVSAASPRVAWAGGEEVLLLTVDGGESWHTVSAEPGYYVYDIASVDEQNCWVVGGAPLPQYMPGRGFILRTRDGARKWELQVVNHTYTFYSISAAGGDAAWAAGGEMMLYGTSGIILRTTDGGTTWTPCGSTDRSWWRIAACDASNAMAWGTVRDGNYPFGIRPDCRRTRDGGATWTVFSDLQMARIYLPYSGAEMLDPQTVWMAASGTSAWSRDAGIAKTVDGGASWSYQLDENYGYPTIPAIDVSAVDRDTAWAVGGYYLLHTTDGGYAGPAPVIDSISPTSGGAYEVVTVEGSNFRERLTVLFGDKPASVESWTDTRIVCRAPETGASDLRVPVTVTTPNGTSNPAHFSYGRGFTVLSIEPNQGSQLSFQVTASIRGTGFLPGATVRLEKGAAVIDAIGANVVSMERIDCVLPLWGAEPGTYDVAVKNPDGSEARLAGGFTVTSACGQGGGAAALLAGASLGLLSLAGSRCRRRRKNRRRATG
ncbi:YCF48-related protein [Candidatus Solincola tengchongensis]|uniref:YCF48-related protein n=1 Tax=Candidatus Solincola tengchongensis TaxID=2900693 RepID=UPI00257FDD26|nr:YCF48-related protein [Candidatus Solincola tengchongensis]